MSLPGTDPVPALRAAQRCGATPILWATGQPIADQLDPLVVWADVPPDGPLPPNVTALIAATERAAAIDPERTDLVRIPAINSIGQLDKALSLLAQSSGPGHLVLVGNEAAGTLRHAGLRSRSSTSAMRQAGGESRSEVASQRHARRR